MEDETKPCGACGKPMASDASFCSACGAAQKVELGGIEQPAAFELTEEEPPAASVPAADREEPKQVPAQAGTTDSDLIEIEFDEVDEEAVPTEGVPTGGESPEGRALDGTNDTDETEASTSEAGDEAEAPETSQTVRMKMSDVIHAWNEDAGVPDEEPGAGDNRALNNRALNKGLPKGFVVALLAIIAIMATVLYFVT